MNRAKNWGEGNDRTNRFRDRIAALAARLDAEGVDAWLMPMGDYHGSEYISDYFQMIAYFTGFTGSAGTLLVTGASAGGQAMLWTDGRYFLQAEQELAGSDVALQRMGQKDVPEITEVLQKLAQANNLKKKGFRLGFDGRCVSIRQAERIRKALKDTEHTFLADRDLAGEIWQEEATEGDRRPPLVFHPVWELAESYAGESVSDKLAKVRECMAKEGADVLLLTALDEIAWLLNLRGEDIAYNPVFLSYLMLTKEEVTLFCGASEMPFVKDCRIEPYENFYDAAKRIPLTRKVWVDDATASYRVVEALTDSPGHLLQKASPVILLKAAKNPVEAENVRKAHIRDGVAVTKWIYGLKERVRKKDRRLPEESELSEAEKLLKLRRQQEDFLGESFAPIIAFGEHGAIVHYEPTDRTDARISFGGGDFLLADTGGHYLQGTTDITRTISLGQPSEEQRKLYTAVLQGHLRLMDACFIEGAAGSSLDQLARQPLYKLGLDYRHGTGHGVGYLLNVHEGPNGIRMKYTQENRIYEGMITSDEPGVYLEGKFGIRIEGLLLACFSHTSEYGRFLRFEPLTMVPFDRDSIDPALLSDEDKRLLNEYHRCVYDNLAEHLSEEEREWLKRETEPFEIH